MYSYTIFPPHCACIICYRGDLYVQLYHFSPSLCLYNMLQGRPLPFCLYVCTALVDSATSLVASAVTNTERKEVIVNVFVTQ